MADPPGRFAMFPIGRKFSIYGSNPWGTPRMEELMAVATATKDPDPKHNLQAARQAWGLTSIHRRRWAFMDRLVWWRTEPPPPVQGSLL